MKNIIDSMNIPNTKKLIYNKLANAFIQHIPDSLYMNYQELQRLIPDSTTQLWEEFLDQPEINRYIESKISKYLEIDARKALNQLANQQLSSQEVSSFKHIIESSKLLKQKQNQHQNIIVTYIPQKNKKEEPINE